MPQSGFLERIESFDPPHDLLQLEWGLCLTLFEGGDAWPHPAGGRAVRGPALLAETRAVIHFDGILYRGRFGIIWAPNMAV